MGSAHRQYQPFSSVDPTTAALLSQMNSNSAFLGQVENISELSQVTVKTETEMLNGVVVQTPYRQEYGFTGYSTGPDGLKYDLGVLSSNPYDGFSIGAHIDYPSIGPADSTGFIIHAHSFTSGSSDLDWSNPGVYVFTIIPGTNQVQIIVPNRSKGYQGTIQQVFPGLGGT